MNKTFTSHWYSKNNEIRPKNTTTFNKIMCINIIIKLPCERRTLFPC